MRKSRTGRNSATRSEAKTQRWKKLQQALAKLTASQEHLSAALRAASGEVRRLLEACPIALLVLDAQGRITDLNEAGARLMGFSRQRLIGSDFSVYFAERERACAAWEETRARGFVSGLMLELRRASGGRTAVCLSAQAWRDENQGLVGAMAVRDISGEKQRQDELAGLQAQLAANAEELKRSESEGWQIRKLYDLLQTCNSPQEAYPAIAAVAAELFPQCAGALAMLVNARRELETVAEWGGETLLPAGFALDDCWALRRGHMREIQQPGTPRECYHFRSAPAAAYACLPLSVRGELQGLLHLRAPPGQRLPQRQGRLLGTLGEVVKLSLCNLKLREVLRERATRDPLTGLFNRHYLEDMLRRELSRAERNQKSLCVVLLDIDGFKAYNDGHGHEAGDAVLRALGGFFQSRLRGSDIACRYGGDEFLLALPDTGVEHFLGRLEELRAEVRGLETACEGSLLPALSVSMGVAQWPGDAGSLKELIRAADRALYHAKRGGRNRIEVCGENRDRGWQIWPLPAGGPIRNESLRKANHGHDYLHSTAGPGLLPG